jgi:hypothetical protein
MPTFEQIRDRLPSLYRPEAGDTSLLTRYLQAIAAVLDHLNQEASQVMQAHWFAYADRALYNPYVQRQRQLRRLPPPSPGNFLITSDLLNPRSLAVKLRDAADPLSLHLRGQLSAATRDRLAAYDGITPLPAAFQKALIDDLNQIIQGSSLYTLERFASIQLPDTTRKLAERSTQGSNQNRLNRLLLEATYPQEIAESLRDSTDIHDLAYLAALLPLAPWQEPPNLRETVEAYRQRIRRTVDIYRNGLGTLSALQETIAASLPVDLELAAELQELPFWLEEFAPLIGRSQPITMPGAPTDLVGPLMRWTVNNGGLAPIPPTVYIQGVAPQTGLIDATINPVLELYRVGDQILRLGIAYQGSLAANQTLRLRPAWSSWLGLDSGIQQSAPHPTDPTAAGPWTTVAGAPTGRAIALHQSQDKLLWVAVNTGATGALWHYDGQDWTVILNNLPQIHCLAERGQELLLGTSSGLQTMPLAPLGDYSASPVTAVSGQSVFAIAQTHQGLWLGTSNGAAQLVGANLQPSRLQNVPVYSIYEDEIGSLYFGTALGLFQHQPGLNQWYWYEGKERSDQLPDWQTFSSTLPVATAVFLPPIRCLQRSSDASLWLGTDNGIARYIATATGDFTYDTHLEAFPDLHTGQVFAIWEDERGLLWFCTDRGLLRYDGRDWWQFQQEPSSWVHLGRADTLYGDTPQPRGAWRYQRSPAGWQRFNSQAAQWQSFATTLRTSAEVAVYSLTWTDQVIAELGSWDGTQFEGGTAIAPSQLLMRYKPTEQRIVNGGIPALPRLPVGDSVWRYLSLEPAELPDRTPPAWTIEGRLLLPPDIEDAPPPGRYDGETPPPASDFDQAVFAYNPAARVWFQWAERHPCTVLARLQPRWRSLSERESPATPFDPILLDRVWQGMQKVRPAAVRTVLAVEETILRGQAP